MLIIGASRGLGRQIAVACARKGHHLGLVARDERALGELAGQLKDTYGTDVSPLPHDLSIAGQARDCARQALDEMGAVDVLVNNAGVGWWRPFLEHSATEHDLISDVNLRAVVHLTHAVLPAMLERGCGHIINIGSDLAVRPLGNMAVYAATKHALRGFSRSLGQEVRPAGIKVSQLNPGQIDSSFGDHQEGELDEAIALKTKPLAQLVVRIMEQPGHQMIDEIEVHATGQDY